MHEASHAPARDHERYLTQARWTGELRAGILKRLQLASNAALLEVGSGTGAITNSLATQMPSAGLFGVDIVHEMNAFARLTSKGSQYVTADGHTLPFCTDSLDAALSHFLLMWVASPGVVLGEMRRVVKPGGWVIAFAEPDYGGRIDHPPELVRLGVLQSKALQNSGADHEMGRKLRALFSNAGLDSIVAGVLGGEWHPDPDERLARSEWATLKADIADLISEDDLNHLHSVDQEAMLGQERILFVPTFYAYGRVV